VDVKCLVLKPTLLANHISLITKNNKLTEQEEHPQLEQSPEQEQVWQLLCECVSLDIMVLALDPRRTRETW
jgi:hypothetical protein